MPTAAKRPEEIFSLAAGVAAALETQSAQKPHQGIFSENRLFHISAEWVKCSGTHQVSEWCAPEIVLGPTIYIYDGTKLLEEVDSSGNALARYTQRGIDEPVAELRSSTTSYYEEDGLGSVTSMSNSGRCIGKHLHVRLIWPADYVE
jgi:hypothetical protein